MPDLLSAGVGVDSGLPDVFAGLRQPPGRGRYASLIRAAELRNGIPAGMLDALIGRESNYNPAARSKSGAVGLGMLRPEIAQELGVDPSDPAQNIEGSAMHLSRLLRQFKDPGRALAAYKVGAGSVQPYQGVPPFPDLLAHVNSIQKHAPIARAVSEHARKMQAAQHPHIELTTARDKAWAASHPAPKVVNITGQKPHASSELNEYGEPGGATSRPKSAKSGVIGGYPSQWESSVNGPTPGTNAPSGQVPYLYTVRLPLGAVTGFHHDPSPDLNAGLPDMPAFPPAVGPSGHMTLGQLGHAVTNVLPNAMHAASQTISKAAGYGEIPDEIFHDDVPSRISGEVAQTLPYFIPGVGEVLGGATAGGLAAEVGSNALQNGPAKAASDVIHGIDPFEPGLAPDERMFRAVGIAAGIHGVSRAAGRGLSDLQVAGKLHQMGFHPSDALKLARSGRVAADQYVSSKDVTAKGAPSLRDAQGIHRFREPLPPEADSVKLLLAHKGELPIHKLLGLRENALFAHRPALLGKLSSPELIHAEQLRRGMLAAEQKLSELDATIEREKAAPHPLEAVPGRRLKGLQAIRDHTANHLESLIDQWRPEVISPDNPSAAAIRPLRMKVRADGTIVIKGDEFGTHSNMEDLRSSAQRYARRVLKYKKFTNAGSKHEITVSPSGIDHVTEARPDRMKLRLSAAIPDMIERAINPGESSDYNKERRLGIYKYMVPVEIAGKKVVVELVIRQAKGASKLYYDHIYRDANPTGTSGSKGAVSPPTPKP